MELKQDTVDVDRWIDRHVGWHFVLFAIGLLGGVAIGYTWRSKTVTPSPDADAAFQMLSECRHGVEWAEERAGKLVAQREAALSDNAKLRAAHASCDKSRANLEDALRRERLEKK